MPHRIEGGVYYTTSEAAKTLGVSSKYLRMLIQDGKIESVQISHLWLIKDVEVARVDHLRVTRLLDKIDAIDARANEAQK